MAVPEWGDPDRRVDLRVVSSAVSCLYFGCLRKCERGIDRRDTILSMIFVDYRPHDQANKGVAVIGTVGGSAKYRPSRSR